MNSEKKVSRTIVTQSLFNTTSVSTSSWRSYITSGLVHCGIIILLLLITFPAIQEQVRRRPESTVLVAPVLPEYKPKIAVSRHIEPLRNLPVVAMDRPKPVPTIVPPEVKPVVAKAPEIAAAPEIKDVPPVVTPKPLPDAKPSLPVFKPEVRTGSFQTAEAARGTQAPKVLKVGGFGDPNGAKPSPDARQSDLAMAKIGSFDLPQGGANGGGGGRGASGGVHETAFGDGGQAGASRRDAQTGAVQTGGFSDSAAIAAQGPVAKAKPAEPLFTPVEILSKPKPVYTEEARNLKLEGQVALDVMFLSNGSIRIVRVLHGLGHGLDEAAEQAAMQVRFRPATRGGVPVDTSATIRITFELT